MINDIHDYTSDRPEQLDHEYHIGIPFLVQTVDWLIFWSPCVSFNLETQKLEIEQFAELST